MNRILTFLVLLVVIVPTGFYILANSGFSPLVFCLLMFVFATVSFIFLQDDDVNFDNNLYNRWITY